MSLFSRNRKGPTPPQGVAALVQNGERQVDKDAYIRQLEASLQMYEREGTSAALQTAELRRQNLDLNRELMVWRHDNGGTPLMSLLCKALDRQQDAVMIAYLDGRLVYGNAAAEAMFGGMVSGQQVHHLFLDDMRCPFKLRTEDTQVNRRMPKPPGHELWDAVIDPTQGFVQDRVEISNVEGEALDIALTMQLLDDQSGQPNFVLIEALDIGSLAKDELTKLFRREVAIRMLTREIAFREKLRSGAEPLSVVFLDLDDFKSINSRYTDEGGDAVLRKVARTLQRCIRSESKDIACRWYSGDEFLAVIYGGEATALLVAERMNEEIRKLEIPFDVPGQGMTNIKVTASIGVASYQSGDAYEDLVRRSTELKTHSKTTGKARVTVDLRPDHIGLAPFRSSGVKADS